MYVSQENNIKNVKSVVPKPDKTKRPALGEISNKVNTMRGVEPLDRTSLLQNNTKKVGKMQKKLPVKAKEKAEIEKPVQVVKPVQASTKTTTTTTTTTTSKSESSESSNTNRIVKTTIVVGAPFNQKRENRKSFSTDLLKFEDIDQKDNNDPILVSFYVNDIHEYLRQLEKQFPVKQGYLAGQEVTPKMRSVLVDWLVDVHQQFRLMQETLYLTVAIVDRFLQSYRTIDREALQLVGVTAMFIASKYEEMYSPDISDFVYITDQAYTKSDILRMEMLIVKVLDYSFGRPLPIHFLRRYSKAGKAHPLHHTMAKYFLEECLICYEMCHYPPSLIAAAALYLAFLIIGNEEEDEGKVIWTDTLIYYSTYKKDDVLPAVREIAGMVVKAEESKYQAVRKKYVQVKHMKVSIRPELKSPVMLALATKSNET